MPAEVATISESPEQKAAQEAYGQYLHNQALTLISTARMLRANIFLAESAGELAPQVKQRLWAECAAIVEMVKEIKV